MKLKEARVCLGEFHKADIASETFDASFRGDQKNDTDTSKTMIIGGGAVGLYVQLIVHDWPREHYSQIVANESRYQSGEMGVSLIRYITQRLPQIFPDATVTFEHVTLYNPESQGAIQNLSSSLLKDLMEGMEDKKADHEFYAAVAERYCFKFGHTEEMRQFSPKSRMSGFMDVQCALYTKFQIDEITEHTINIVDEVLQIHWQCRGTPHLDFEKEIDSRWFE